MAIEAYQYLGKQTERISNMSNGTERAYYSETENHHSMPTIPSASPMIVKRSFESSSALVFNEGSHTPRGGADHASMGTSVMCCKAASSSSQKGCLD